MSKFQELLDQLRAEQEAQDTLVKSLPANADDDDDEKIEIAADDDDATIEEDDDDSHPLAKSLTLPNGEEALDATETLEALQKSLADHDEVLAKALPQFLQLMQGQSNALQQQGELIKSLQQRIDQLAGQGRGRKTVVTVSEKIPAGEDPLAKSQQQGMTPQDFMLKANSAFDKGIITGTQLTTIDVSLRQNVAIAPELISKIVNS